MTVEIKAFTPRQRELADHIWSIETPEQLVKFFEVLPQDLLPDAYFVYKMIIETVMDDMDWGDCVEANQVIDIIRRLPGSV